MCPRASERPLSLGRGLLITRVFTCEEPKHTDVPASTNMLKPTLRRDDSELLEHRILDVCRHLGVVGEGQRAPSTSVRQCAQVDGVPLHFGEWRLRLDHAVLACWLHAVDMPTAT